MKTINQRPVDVERDFGHLAFYLVVKLRQPAGLSADSSGFNDEESARVKNVSHK